MSNKGRIIIISAPSGTGKTTVVRQLLKQNPAMLHSISHTTRALRGSEQEGVDYIFISEPQFQKNKVAGIYAEWAFVHGNYYGTPKEPLEKAVQEGRDILLDIDIQGGLQLKQKYPENTITIFLLPPSEAELEKRLHARGTDSPEARARRLENAKKELQAQNQYSHQVINDDLDHACQTILSILATALH